MHPDGHIDRPVGDLGVTNLDDHRVDQQHRIHRIQGPALPGDEVLDHPVGDLRDRVSGDLSVVDL
jgi:hypothetical protein